VLRGRRAGLVKQALRTPSSATGWRSGEHSGGSRASTEAEAGGKAIGLLASARAGTREGEWADNPWPSAPGSRSLLARSSALAAADVRSRFALAYVEVPRKNGKSLLAAGQLVSTVAFFDSEGWRQVYAAATKRDQAKIMGRRQDDGLASLTCRRPFKVLVGNSPHPHNATVRRPSVRWMPWTGLPCHGGPHRTNSRPQDARPLGSSSPDGDGSQASAPHLRDHHRPARAATRLFTNSAEYAGKLLDGLFYDSFFATSPAGRRRTTGRSRAPWEKANPTNRHSPSRLDDLPRQRAQKAQHSRPSRTPSALTGNEWTSRRRAGWTWRLRRQHDEPTMSFCAEEMLRRHGSLQHDRPPAVELFFPDDDVVAVIDCTLLRTGGERAQACGAGPCALRRLGGGGVPLRHAGNVVDFSTSARKLNALREQGYEIEEVATTPGTRLPWSPTCRRTASPACPSARASPLSPRRRRSREALLGNDAAHRWQSGHALGGEQRERGDGCGGQPQASKAKSTERIDPIVAMVMAVDRASRHIEEAPRKASIFWGHEKYVPGAIRPARAGPYGGGSLLRARPSTPADPHLLPAVDRFHTQTLQSQISHQTNSCIARERCCHLSLPLPRSSCIGPYITQGDVGVNRSEGVDSGGRE